MRRLLALLAVLLLLPVYAPVSAGPAGGGYAGELAGNATEIYSFLYNHSAALGIANETLAAISGNLTLAENQSNETLRVLYLKGVVRLELNVSASAVAGLIKPWKEVDETLGELNATNCSGPVKALIGNLTELENGLEKARESFNGTINASMVIGDLNKTIALLSTERVEAIANGTRGCLIKLMDSQRRGMESELGTAYSALLKLMTKTTGTLKTVENLEKTLDGLLNATSGVGNVSAYRSFLLAKGSELRDLRQKLRKAESSELKLKGEIIGLNGTLEEGYENALRDINSTANLSAMLNHYRAFIGLYNNVSSISDEVEGVEAEQADLAKNLTSLEKDLRSESVKAISGKAGSLQEEIESLYSTLREERELLLGINATNAAISENVTALERSINETLERLIKWNSSVRSIEGNAKAVPYKNPAPLVQYWRDLGKIEMGLKGVNVSGISSSVQKILALSESATQSSSSSTTSSTPPRSSTTPASNTTASTTPGKSKGAGHYIILILKGIIIAAVVLLGIIAAYWGYYVFRQKREEYEIEKQRKEEERRREEELQRYRKKIEDMGKKIRDIERELRKLGLSGDPAARGKLEELRRMVGEADEAFQMKNYARVSEISRAFAEKAGVLIAALEDYGKTLKLDLGSHVAADSYIGRRENNEDAYIADKVGGNVLLAVADGMGGHLAGEVASAKAIEILKETLGLNKFGDPKDILREAILRANEEVYRMGHDPDHPERYNMGTTLTAAIVRGDTATVGNVGDSRTYLIRDGSIERLTKDHSLVQELIDRGEITEEEARRHPQKNIITKAIGIEKELRLDEGDVREVKLKPGDYLLLCSDGLSDALPDEDILKTVLSARSLQEAVKLLIDKAYSFGSDDNITVVLYRH